jgi:sigma-B regulation protein RsbU (phosphoserine phosphatase)
MDADGTARYIERGGVPLGMFQDTRYYEYYLAIEPGQLIVLYTDGVTEATNSSGEEYGRSRLEETVRAGRDLTARELIRFIHGDVMDWTEGLGANDDITLFIIKAEGNSEGADSSPGAPLLSI